MEWLWLTWLFSGLILAGLVYVLDNYFIEAVFHNEYECSVISSLFNIIPAGAILAAGLKIEFNGEAIIAAAGGFLLMLAYLFYFKCLFSLNDSSFLDIVWNLATPLMLLMAWIFLGEVLKVAQYAGIALILLGAVVLDIKKFDFRGGWRRYFISVAGLIFFYSASSTLMRSVYLEKEIAFSNVFFFFCLGQVIFGLTLFIVSRKRIAVHEEFLPLIKKYCLVFFSAETLELAGAFSIQKAISTTTSFSLFSGMLATMGLGIILVGFGFVAVLRFPHPFFEEKRAIGEAIWSSLVFNWRHKVLATFFIVLGVCLL